MWLYVIIIRYIYINMINRLFIWLIWDKGQLIPMMLRLSLTKLLHLLVQVIEVLHVLHVWNFSTSSRFGKGVLSCFIMWCLPYCITIWQHNPTYVYIYIYQPIIQYHPVLTPVKFTSLSLPRLHCHCHGSNLLNLHRCTLGNCLGKNGYRTTAVGTYLFGANPVNSVGDFGDFGV